MHPYRPLHVSDEPSDPGLDDDDRVLAVLLMALGLARVVPALVTGEPFGVEATIAAIMVAGGAATLLRLPRRLRRWRSAK